MNKYFKLSENTNPRSLSTFSCPGKLFHSKVVKKIQTIEIFVMIRLIILSFFILYSPVQYLFAQESSYKINEKDLLEITFWEYPEMNAQVRVNNDGTISLPLIGSTMVEGFTIQEVIQKITTQMAIYNKVINQVNIKVLEYGYNKVIVTGQVFAPGKYYFEEIPDLWEIIMEAGGPLEDARLDEVLIIRKENEGAVNMARVATALKEGTVNELPKVMPGDAVHVRGAVTPFKISRNGLNVNEFFILGAVGSPGLQEFKDNLNILDAIGQAGGPTSEANLSKISYVAVHEEGTTVSKINLNHYLNNSVSTPLPIVDPGSTIYIPRRRGLSPFLTTVVTTAVVAAITAFIYVSIR